MHHIVGGMFTVISQEIIAARRPQHRLAIGAHTVTIMRRGRFHAYRPSGRELAHSRQMLASPRAIVQYPAVEPRHPDVLVQALVAFQDVARTNDHIRCRHETLRLRPPCPAPPLWRPHHMHAVPSQASAALKRRAQRRDCVLVVSLAQAHAEIHGAHLKTPMRDQKTGLAPPQGTPAPVRRCDRLIPAQNSAPRQRRPQRVKHSRTTNRTSAPGDSGAAYRSALRRACP